MPSEDVENLQNGCREVKLEVKADEGGVQLNAWHSLSQACDCASVRSSLAWDKTNTAQPQTPLQDPRHASQLEKGKVIQYRIVASRIEKGRVEL